MRRKRGRCDDDGDDSLSESEAKQGILLDVPPHPLEAEARTEKRCTATLLYERDRETYDAVVKQLAESSPIRRIKRDFGLGTDTVMAIRRRESREVGTLKALIADTLLHGAAVGAEVAAALVAECEDPVAAAMATKMMAETGNLMRGQATQIIGGLIVHVDATAAANKLEAKALEMGFGSGGKPALREPRPSDLAVGVSVDHESAVCMAQTVDSECVFEKGHTPSHTPPTLDGDFQTRGGGGASEDSCPSP